MASEIWVVEWNWNGEDDWHVDWDETCKADTTEEATKAYAEKRNGESANIKYRAVRYIRADETQR